MPGRHLDEKVCPQLAEHFEGVVPADWMRDAGCEILAYGLGIVEGAAAAIAHIGDRRRPQIEPGHSLRQAIRDRLKQRAMRRDADRQALGAAAHLVGVPGRLPRRAPHQLRRRRSAEVH